MAGVKRTTRIYNRIADVFGDIESLKMGESLKAEADGYMPLILSALYEIPEHKGIVVSLAHYGEQNGDLMADPEMEILLIPSVKGVIPMSFRNDYVGSYRRAVWVDEERGLVARPAEMRDEEYFLDTWTNNVKHQGHRLKAAEAQGAA